MTVVRISFAISVVCAAVLLVGYRLEKYYQVKALIPSTEYVRLYLKSANKLRVEEAGSSPYIRDGGDVHPYPATYWEIKGKERVSEIVQAIEVQGNQEISFWSIPKEVTSKHDMCEGDFVLVFMEGEKEIASISVHHGESIRWRESSWAGDANLKPGSGEKLIQALERNGFENVWNYVTK